MKKEHLSDAMELLDEDIIRESEALRSNNQRSRRWAKIAAAAAAFILFVGIGAVLVPKIGKGTITGESMTNAENGEEFMENMEITSGFALAEAEYPEMAGYPNEESFFNEDGRFDSDGFSAVYDAWREDIRTQQNQYAGYNDGLDDMFLTTTQQFLSGSEGKNRIYSPLNVYMALSMLCEITDGESRRQILDLMGVDSVEEVRKQAGAVWNANYRNDGATKCVLANSIWLNEQVGYRQETMDCLARNYYASSYSGKMGTSEYDEALRAWLNTQTDGLLADQAEGISMDARTVISLASTINFRAKWQDEFFKGSTEEGVFHAPDGEITCDFMHMSNARNYYWSEKFGAVSMPFNNGGRMLLVLPDEGVSVDELVADREEMETILGGLNEQNRKRLTVNLSVPKFDVSSDISLVEGLKTLGVTDVFSFEQADFSPLTDEVDQMAVSNASHAARVQIDEEGCVAVAYTVMSVCGAAMPPQEQVDFVLDRPFMFAILADDGLPLFAGVVNQPV